MWSCACPGLLSNPPLDFERQRERGEDMKGLGLIGFHATVFDIKRMFLRPHVDALPYSSQTGAAPVSQRPGKEERTAADITIYTCQRFVSLFRCERKDFVSSEMRKSWGPSVSNLKCLFIFFFMLFLMWLNYLQYIRTISSWSVSCEMCEDRMTVSVREDALFLL